ncbi:MAG: hypothetical protein IPM93_24685, partial [Candidatus Obscuribacter sp.]|nr:hypothetical protein [Candidatus Obscuribacter sp.]
LRLDAGPQVCRGIVFSRWASLVPLPFESSSTTANTPGLPTCRCWLNPSRSLKQDGIYHHLPVPGQAAGHHLWFVSERLVADCQSHALGAFGALAPARCPRSDRLSCAELIHLETLPLIVDYGDREDFISAVRHRRSLEDLEYDRLEVPEPPPQLELTRRWQAKGLAELLSL